MKKIMIITCVLAGALALLWAEQPCAQVLQVDNDPNSPGFGYYIPNYFGTTPNWANSPPLRKFVDTLAPLGCTTPNNLGQCIPVAVPDTTTYPGSDYYEIELVQYRERMHSDFPALDNADKMLATSGGTKLRGYRQVNGGRRLADAALSRTDHRGHEGQARAHPVRQQPSAPEPEGTSSSRWTPSIMGSGPFEINYNPETKAPITPVSGHFAQNRATLHLHGGRTPWISDGTPHQWITPAGETTAYPKGVSVAYVPDMWFTGGRGDDPRLRRPDDLRDGRARQTIPGPGRQTFF